MAREATDTNLCISAFANSTLLVEDVLLEAAKATRSNLAVPFPADSTSWVVGSEATKTLVAHFCIAFSADSTSWEVKHMSFVARKTSGPNLCISSSAHAAAITQAVRPASEALEADLLVPNIAHTALREIQHLILEAGEATPTNLGISALAASTSGDKAIEVAREASSSNLLIAAAACRASWWGPEVLDGLLRSTCKTVGANLCIAVLTHPAPRKLGVDGAGEAKGIAARLGVALLATRTPR